MNTKENNELIPIGKVDTEALIKALIDKKDIAESSRKDFKIRTPLLLDFLDQHKPNRDSYIEYKRYLSNRTDFAVSTKAKYLYVARIVFQELHRQGILPVDITVGIKGFKQSRLHKKDGINDKEMEKLMKAVKKLPENPTTIRLKTILYLLALQGMRQIEISRLDVEDIDLVAKTIMIQGKGKDDKEKAPLHLKTVEALQKYIVTSSRKSGALFVSQSNNSLNHRLTTRSIRGIIKDLLKILAITKTTHGFRHYFTSTLIKTYKGDLTVVAGYTRHKRIETLQIYNDNIKKESDLPRYYKTFDKVDF